MEADLTRLEDRPALLIWGDEYIAFRTTEPQRFERAFPRRTVVDLPGAGHYVQEDAPKLIARAIHPWWDSLEHTA